MYMTYTSSVRGGGVRALGAWARRRILLVLLAGSTTLLLSFLVSASPAAALPRTASGAVIELPVSFTVQNTNSSQDPCPSDGATYTIRGHITAPAGALSVSPRTITMYLSGYEGGQWNWDLKVPGYDYAAEMAKLGHMSLTLDELGYGQSGFPPDGNLTCQ